MSIVWRTCAWKKCGVRFPAREADVKRGWGKFHNKSCKAKEQESRTGQNAAYQQRQERRRDADDESPSFDQAHLFSNEDHNCNKD